MIHRWIGEKRRDENIQAKSELCGRRAIGAIATARPLMVPTGEATGEGYRTGIRVGMSLQLS